MEEVCKKQGLVPNEYDLKHHKNVLDTTAIIRFSGLPNNAQLEMCAAQRTRQEGSVTLGVQLENGARLTGDFTPSDTLYQVVNTLCPEQLDEHSDDIVIIYMRNEVIGVEALRSTSLRSLGLTGGRAMLRLMHRTLEQLKTQANVSSALPSKPPQEQPYIRRMVTTNEASTNEKEKQGSPPPKKQEQQVNNKNLMQELLKQEKKTKKDQHKQKQVKDQQEPMEVDKTDEDGSTVKQKRQMLTQLPDDLTYVSISISIEHEL